jgi:hypothetical protein
VGVEPNEYMDAYAKEKATALGLQLEVVRCEVKRSNLTRSANVQPLLRRDVRRFWNLETTVARPG